jgi:hypothetical protein
MPFQSGKQRKYLWANEPAIAKRWEKYPKGYNTGGVSHLFRSKEDRTGFNKGTEKKDGTGLIIWGKSVADQWPNLNESQKDYIRKHWPQHVPKGHAQGGYIRPEEDGVLGLADGGRIGFNAGSMLVAPTTDGSRPGYAYDDYEDMGFGDGPDMGSEMGVEDMSGVGENDGDDGGVPDYESGSPENTWATMSPEMAEKSKAETERVLGDHGDPMGNSDERAKYARYVKYTLKDQIKKEDSKVVKFLKNAAMVVIPGLLPAKLAMGWKVGKGIVDYRAGKYDRFLPIDFQSKGKYAQDIEKTVKENLEKIQEKAKLAKELEKKSAGLGGEEFQRRTYADQLKLLQFRDKDEQDGDGDKTTTTEDVSKDPTKEEMIAASLRALQMLYGDRRSAQIPEDTSKRDAYYNAYRNKYMSAKGGRVPGYNTGGLSSLFRLKNK